MPYSEKELAEIGKDPVRLRAYFWHVAMNASRMAKKARANSRHLAIVHPVTNYRPVHDEGVGLLAEAARLDRFSHAILTHIDALVETTII